MKITIMVVLAGLVALSWFQFKDNSAIRELEDDLLVSTSTSLTEYRLEAQGLAFFYESGDTGYTLEEQDINKENEPHLIRSLNITPTRDYIDQKTRTSGEGSPAWSLRVYQNVLRASPSIWVDANKLESNINLATSPEKEVVIAGVNAVTYTIDGLYPARVVVVAHGGLIFVAAGSYLDETSQTYKDFDGWVSSFAFVPSKTP